MANKLRKREIRKMATSLYSYNLARIMKERGVSAIDLASQAEISYSIIYRYLRGIDLPTLNTALVISVILGVKLNDFFVEL